jgi:glucosamine kinase
VTAVASAGPGVALGLDVGGSQTRWALASATGDLLGEGVAPPFAGQQAASAEGRKLLVRALQMTAAAAQRSLPGHRPFAMWAGVTGFDAQAGDDLRQLLSEAFALPPASVQVFNDVEMACRLSFLPGAGYLIYAGTGAMGMFVDDAGEPHHVGGRGAVLGDEGGGYWIAREALARLWRDEDNEPGSAAASPLGRHLFAAVGGARWDDTRRFIEVSSRGDVGRLALAVVAAAAHDERALEVLRSAGRQLARLGQLLWTRHGPRPLAVAGRAAGLHPVIHQALMAGLPAGAQCRALNLRTHVAAAVRAAQDIGA